MDQKVNLAIQILPKTNGVHPYDVVDKAISVIQNSGLPYVVCPFETVIEGTYEQVMKVAREAQDICFETGAEEIIVNMKLQRRKASDVFIDDKIGKYK